MAGTKLDASKDSERSSDATYENEEEDYEEVEEGDEMSSKLSQPSQYPYYNPDQKQAFVGFTINAQERVQKLVIPAGMLYHITAVSMSANNQSTARHIVSLFIDEDRMVLARLLPNKNESAQLDVVIPPKAHERPVFFILDGEGVGDVDVCGMMYVAEEDEDDDGEEEYEEVSEGEYNRVIEHQGKYCNHKCSSCPMHAQCGGKEEKP